MDMEIDWTKPTTSRLVGNAVFHVESPADRFIEAMDGRTDEDMITLAMRSLRHDPGSMDAHLFLADWPSYDGERELHLKKVIETGEHLFGPIEREGRVILWWLDNSTRPYMRAIAALGQLRLEQGNVDAAAECFERLMTMNPNDNQGIRYLLGDLEVGGASERAGLSL